MRALTALLVLGLVSLPAAAPAGDDSVVTTAPQVGNAAKLAEPVDLEAHYQALLAQAKAKAPESDWAGLRFAYAARPGFKAFGQDTAKSDMFKAVEAGDCDKAAADSRTVIEQAYVDADAHLVAAFCDDKAGDAAGAVRERDVGVGLLKSIETPGDGLSPDKAFVVIDVDEEYALIRARGLKVTNQALIQQGGHSYDALTTLDDKGASATLYFLIDRVLEAEAAAPKPGP